MATVTQKDIRDRIEAILTAMPAITTVITEDDHALADEALPAAIVMTRGATREKVAAGLYRTTRTFEIGVLIKRLSPGIWTAAEQYAQMVAAENFIEVVPDYFAHLDRLALNNQKLSVYSVGLMTDNGLETREFGQYHEDGNVYYAVSYSLAVTTSR